MSVGYGIVGSIIGGMMGGIWGSVIGGIVGSFVGDVAKGVSDAFSKGSAGTMPRRKAQKSGSSNVVTAEEFHYALLETVCEARGIK